jgi:coenzyme Q-binding protein COQ10
MPDFFTHRHVAHSVDEMFSLVADVERYPEFLPFCQAHAIRSRRVRDGVELLTTDMTVGHLMFRETFRSLVTLDRANSRILIVAADGPLRRLDGRWIFRDDNSGGCEVSFSMSYELASRALAVVMGPMLKAAFSNFVQAFERRAAAVYGRARHVPCAPSLQPGLPPASTARAHVAASTGNPD